MTTNISDMTISQFAAHLEEEAKKACDKATGRGMTEIVANQAVSKAWEYHKRNGVVPSEWLRKQALA